jgi:hypothetical protein
MGKRALTNATVVCWWRILDPRKLFADIRHTGMCVYCGAAPDTRDHVPPRVLIDRPYPANLPVVPACRDCNQGFSMDEAYVACAVECAVHGSADPDRLHRESVARLLRGRPGLSAAFAGSLKPTDSGGAMLEVDLGRVGNVALKLARGHAAYELSEPQLHVPTRIVIRELAEDAESEASPFEVPPDEHLLSELGSRAFHKIAVRGLEGHLGSGWEVIQPGRYRYLVTWSSRIGVCVVMSEYLACEVVW